MNLFARSKPMKVFVIQTTCLRCGNVNQTDVGLTNKEDNAVYKCNHCGFIIFTSWMEEKDD